MISQVEESAFVPSTPRANSLRSNRVANKASSRELVNRHLAYSTSDMSQQISEPVKEGPYCIVLPRMAKLIALHPNHIEAGYKVGSGEVFVTSKSKMDITMKLMKLTRAVKEEMLPAISQMLSH